MAEDTAYQQELDALKDDIRQLRADLKGMYGVFKSNAKNRFGTRLADAAQERLEAIREAAARGMERTREAAGQVRDAGAKAVERVQMKVEERPLTSVLVAFGVGWLIGRVMMRRK